MKAASSAFAAALVAVSVFPAPAADTAAGATASEAVPAVRIATWKGDAKGAVSLYYDDGTESSFRNVAPALIRLGIPGTFYICGGWYGGEDDPKLTRWSPLAKEHPGVIVLGDHTWAHGGVADAAQFADEISRNGALLRKLSGLPENALVSFALPGAVRWDITREEQAAVLAEHNEALRHDFGPNVGGPSDGNNPTFRMRTFENAVEALDRAERTGGWESLLFHGVGGDWIAYDLDAHNRLLDELARRRDAGRLWIGSAIDVHKYEAERQAAKVRVFSKNEMSIRSDLAPDALLAFEVSFGDLAANYDGPLTFVADVPGDVETVSVNIKTIGRNADGSRNGEVRAEIPFQVAVKDGKAVFDVAPGTGLLLVAVEPVRDYVAQP
jgi:peptidoglycan/xylan/chitin deacetylase (PgdA/CDA1 family)